MDSLNNFKAEILLALGYTEVNIGSIRNYRRFRKNNICVVLYETYDIIDDEDSERNILLKGDELFTVIREYELQN